MIKKALVAEDHECVSISVQKALEELRLQQIDHVSYCDVALMKIKKALQNNDSYDILITDLSFKKDHLDQQLSDGAALIAAARKVQPDLKVLVFSVEDRPAVVKNLFDAFGIDGYVPKSRGDKKELKKALDHINANQQYYPPNLVQQIKEQERHLFTAFDKMLIAQMLQVKRQPEIAEYFKKNNIRPSSLSSIEKRLAVMKEALGFATNEQLVAHCVKNGIV
ncbi:response regulator [Niabella sp.]|uniref:response regulator n=1 Tax=Niabella sp. TaxID=1962976 RepID=UPI0026222D11|nr:response regulator [Niabella sp.]